MIIKKALKNKPVPPILPGFSVVAALSAAEMNSPVRQPGLRKSTARSRAQRH
jgi:hypothetical protein